MSIKTRISYYRSSLFSSRTSALQLEVSTKKRTIKLVLTSKTKATLLQQITFLRRICSDSSFCQFSDPWGRSLGQTFIGCPSWSTRSTESPAGWGVTGEAEDGKMIESWEAAGGAQRWARGVWREPSNCYSHPSHHHAIQSWHHTSHESLFSCFFLLSGGNIREWRSFWKLPINLGSLTVRETEEEEQNEHMKQKLKEQEAPEDLRNLLFTEARELSTSFFIFFTLDGEKNALVY